jgi:hypothetical protein
MFALRPEQFLLLTFKYQLSLLKTFQMKNVLHNG